MFSHVEEDGYTSLKRLSRDCLLNGSIAPINSEKRRLIFLLDISNYYQRLQITSEGRLSARHQ